MSAVYEFRYDTGRVCLDLVATVGGRLGSSPVERLDSASRLREWLVGSGLVPQGQQLEVDDGWLREFQALREVLHRTIHAELGERGAAEPDLRRLNGRAAAAPPAIQAERAPDGTLRRRLAHPVTLDALLSAVAADALSLLTGTHRADLRECTGDTCDLVFLDASRGRRRLWCSGTACGNRQRVARHRARTR